MPLSPTPPAGVPRVGTDPLEHAVSETLKALARAVRSFQLYLPNNPMHVRAIDSARSAFVGLWAHCESVEIAITETDFRHDEIVVYTEGGRGGESLPWLFYKDGIRTFEIRKGFEVHELPKFLGALQAVRTQALGDEDLVTLFWECDFEQLSYRYEEAGGDGYAAPGAELMRGGAPAGSVDAPIENETDAGTYGAGRSQFARISDFDSTLYFLDEREITYLNQAIHDDFTSDLRPSVAAALLDTFETQSDPEIREEICGILENFMLVLLSGLQFRTISFLVRESEIALSRASDVLPSHNKRVRDLLDLMSNPATLNQLLDALEHNQLQPSQQDIVALFAHLKTGALAPLVSHLVYSRNGELRTILEESVTRLAGSHTEELTALIGSSDEAVALESMRRAGDMQSHAAVASLAKNLESPSDVRRAAAVAALARIGSPGAMHALERALDDVDRDIRIAVVLACAERHFRPVQSRLEKAIKERLTRDGSSVEKTAFFDAYATLAGDSSVPLLENILLPHGLLARKEDPMTRASAAMALGKLGTQRAFDVLRKAGNDKDIVVRSAAARALRGSA
jgi:HEAT repeat protein